MKKILYTLLLFPVFLFGQENYSIKFSEGEYVRFNPIEDIFSVDDLTMEIWYFELGAAGEENIIGNEWFGGSFEIYRDSDGSIAWGEDVISHNPNLNNSWIHIAVTY